jgi:hypothetical protein
VPFIRQVRDKRGYETTFIMHAYRPGPGPQRTRVLYLFRSPTHIKFGRRALDEEAREALEHTHPDVSFDWSVLDREFAAVRPEIVRPRERPGRVPRRPAPAVAGTAPAPVPVIVDDQTMAGRLLGAAQAARLRARYAEGVQRIGRRARTPEDRDRLLQRAQRLNPDDWLDDTAVRAGATAAEAEWEALLAELPTRRRGRRGGRRRLESDSAGGDRPASPGDEDLESSGIIEPRGGAESDEGPKDVQVAGGDRPASGDGDRDRVGPARLPGAVQGDD